jgi:hypothetical protein
MFSPTRPPAFSVTNAVSGHSRYCAFSGACDDFSSSAVISYFRRRYPQNFKGVIINTGLQPGATDSTKNKPFQRFECGEKPLKRLIRGRACDTRLKPGVNEMRQTNNLISH